MTEVPTVRGKVVVVTGASAGIGWATALALGGLGAQVVVTARREQRLKKLVADIEAMGGAAAYFAGDASMEATAVETLKVAVERFGRVDILINNAGVGNYKNLVDTSVEEYDALMDSNMKSSFLFSRHVAPGMIAQKSGNILFISSVAGVQGYPGEAVYCASKFAQVGFAQALDGELRKHGVKVGTICPGGVKTEFAVGKGRTVESVRDSYMMEASEVAEAIVFACLQPANARIVQMTVRHMGEPGR